jgi:hypothetical protein
MTQFIPTLLMSLELIVFEVLFCRGFRKKEYSWVKLLGGSLIVLVFVFWIEVFYVLVTGSSFGYGESASQVSSSIFRFLYYLFTYLMTIGVMLFTFHESFPQILMACCGGYAIQHLTYNLASFFDLIPIENDTWANVFTYSIRIIFDILGYLVIYFLIRRQKIAKGMYQGNQTKKLILSLVAILICIGLSRLTKDDPERGTLATIAETLYAIVACFLILSSLFNINDSDVAHDEVDVMKELLHQEREQYKLSKKNIELINIKCHDLKHQISALRENANEKSIEEIEHAIMIYDSSIKTGNDVLDVILREKALQCESEHITLTCMVKGELLSFMETMDIYSLFGNILSNAIEATKNIKDADKRIITLNARKVGDILSLHCENFYEGELTMIDSLPQTTKNNKDNHGFGMKSMQRTTEKYHGVMNVSAKEHRFSLDFIFPL